MSESCGCTIETKMQTSDVKPASDWAHLPELLELVFSKLPAIDVVRGAALTCHRWHHVATSSAAVWDQRFGSYTTFAHGLMGAWPGERPWPKLWGALAPRNMLPPPSDVRFDYQDRLQSAPPKPFPPGAHTRWLLQASLRC